LTQVKTVFAPLCQLYVKCVSSGAVTTTNNGTAKMAPQKILVVFYSRTGTTRTVAQALAADLRCESEEIVPVKSRAGFLGVMRSLIEAMRRRPAAIEPARSSAAAYDLVIIGTPVWAWSVSSPVRAYLMANRKNLPRVAFFCTLGNRGDDGALAQMQSLVGEAPHATAAFKMRDVAAGRFRETLAAFVRALETSALQISRRPAA
jgi:flavodoxin